MAACPVAYFRRTEDDGSSVGRDGVQVGHVLEKRDAIRLKEVVTVVYGRDCDVRGRGVDAENIYLNYKHKHIELINNISSFTTNCT